MEPYIKKIDSSTEVITILNTIAEAMKEWVTEHLTSKEFGYIKGYADCKIKQLQK